jgi:hypothetical protein
MEGFSLKELLLSYDEIYMLEVYVEGMIDMKIYIYSFSKRMEGDCVLKFHFEDREGVEQGILFWCWSNDVLFLKLLSTFPSANDGIVYTHSKTNRLRREPPTHWIFQEGYIKKEIATVQNL